MKNKSHILLFLFIYFLIQPNQSSIGMEKTLSLINKIFIVEEHEYILTPDAIKRETNFYTSLKKELNRYGFQTVNYKENADAILQGEYGDWIVLDGPAFDPPKYNYKYGLINPVGQRIWKIEFDMQGRQSVEEIDNKAAHKIADKLYKDYRKSLKR